MIDAGSDGLDQIAGILKSEHLGNLSGIQIVAHGAAGELELGSTTLNDSDLSDHASALATIGNALASGGDLSLYACDTAQGASGQQFIADLSHLAGVNVAAINYHFRDKAELYLRVLREAKGLCAGLATTSFPGAPEEQLRGFIHGFVRGLLDPAGHLVCCVHSQSVRCQP